jgi:hypothetical protein
MYLCSFEIGQIENGVLKIVPVEHMQTQRIRGSTPPVWCAALDCYICVVHYCEHIHGAKTLAYYHMLVKLGKKIMYHLNGLTRFISIGWEYNIVLDSHFYKRDKWRFGFLNMTETQD